MPSDLTRLNSCVTQLDCNVKRDGAVEGLALTYVSTLQNGHIELAVRRE